MASVVANDAASFNSKGRVAICELDMALSWRLGPREGGRPNAASSHGIPTQISGLLKTRLNLLARERQWKIAICGKIALGIFSLYLTD